MTTLYTIGYQGQNIDSFLEHLLAHGVEQVIDVRERPFSRKPDFSKKRLVAHLAGVGIAYEHLVALGTPKVLRDEVRQTHDYEAFFAAMRALLATQGEAVQAALDLARARRSALLCFEASHAECHRLVVADAIVEAASEPITVAHLHG